MTVDQFVAAFTLKDERYELRNGVPVRTTGTRARNSRIQVNVAAKIDASIDKGPCQVFCSGLGLKISEYEFRLPSVAIYCEPAELAPENDDAQYFRYPRVVIEIHPLSVPMDMLTRVVGYQQLRSVDTIVLIDSDSYQFTTWLRAGGEAWMMATHDQGAPLQLRDPKILLTYEDVFRLVGGAMKVETPSACGLG